MGTIKKTVMAALLFAFTAFAFAACGGDDGDGGGESSEPIKIGVLMDLSQTYGFIGEPALAGVRTAADAINRDGGINGREIELIVQDDRSDVANARTLYQQMVDEGAVAVIGPNASATLVPLAPLIEKLEVPDVSLAAVSELHKPGKPYLYATGLHVADSALIDLEYFRQRAEAEGIEAPKLGAVTLDTPSVQELRDTLKDSASNINAELVANEVVAPDATDMNTAVLPVAQAEPDFVPVGLLATQLPGAVSSLRNRGVDAPVINYFVASDTATFKAVNDENFLAVRQYVEPDEEGVPGLETMKEEAREAGQEKGLTNAYFTYGYVTTKLVAEAIEQCGEDCDGPALNEALAGITEFDTDGLSGPLGVGEDDHLFVKYGRVFSWDPKAKKAVPEGDWIDARAAEAE